MKISIKISMLTAFTAFATQVYAQPVTCPAPAPSSPNCYQTNRGITFGGLTSDLWQKDPNPNQDCCNATPLCAAVNTIENGTVMPPHPNGPNANWTTPWFPGCVRDELPIDANTCFSNNEKGTTWYKFKIRPLPGGPTNFGDPAGKLRFRIIPQDAFDDPDYDPDGEDLGSISYGNTDYDFLLFDVTAASNSGEQCSLIKNSTTFTNPTSVIKSCNWTGTRGPTGLFEPGTGSEMSQGTAARFNKPLDVTVGQVFILAIDNFTAGDQGFTIIFNSNSTITPAMGLSAIVTPPPLTESIRFKRVNPNVCPSKSVTVIFTSELLCDFVIPSNFKINGPNAPYVILSMTPVGGCNGSGSDTSFIMTISPDLPDSNLRLVVINSITDICGNKLLKDSISFRVIPCLIPVNDRTSSNNYAYIFPNPNNGKFQIRKGNEALKPSEITIMDIQGKILLKTFIPENEMQIDLHRFEKGIYFIKIQNATFSETLRWVKE
jgi:hypothetical protein